MFDVIPLPQHPCRNYNSIHNRQHPITGASMPKPNNVRAASPSQYQARCAQQDDLYVLYQLADSVFRSFGFSHVNL